MHEMEKFGRFEGLRRPAGRWPRRDLRHPSSRFRSFDRLIVRVVRYRLCRWRWEHVKESIQWKYRPSSALSTRCDNRVSPRRYKQHFRAALPLRCHSKCKQLYLCLNLRGLRVTAVAVVRALLAGPCEIATLLLV